MLRLKREKTPEELERTALLKTRSKRRRQLELMGTLNSPYGLRDISRRQVNFSEGCYQARRHNTADRGLRLEDDIESTSLFELGRQSCTCEILDPEEAMIQAMEAAFEYEASLAYDYTGEITDGSNSEPEPAHIDINEKYYHLEHPEQAQLPAGPTEESGEEPPEPSLADYFAKLFGLTPNKTEIDEHHFGICCKEPKVPYRSRPNWATT